MTFSTLPDRRAAADPGAAAVADSTHTLTNQELLERVRSVAAQLMQHGIGTADVVAAWLTNRVEFVTLMFTAWRVGATITPVNPALTPAEVTRQHIEHPTREQAAGVFATMNPIPTPWVAMAIGTAGYTAGLSVVALQRHGLTPASAEDEFRKSADAPDARTCSSPCPRSA
jgi:acyl-CoA synthetase (AMP-forming)/AMP-acid ligase II